MYNKASDYHFWQGILFALRERGETFISYGPQFHDSFKEALEIAKEDGRLFDAASRAEDSFDPVFGVFHDASNMVNMGIGNYIICLEPPANITARFKITKEQATKILDSFFASESFRKMVAQWK